MKEKDIQEEFLKAIRKKSCIQKDQLFVPYETVKALITDKYDIVSRKPARKSTRQLEEIPGPDPGGSFRAIRRGRGRGMESEEDYAGILEKLSEYPHILNLIGTWSIMKNNVQLQKLPDKMRVGVICNYYFQKHGKTVETYDDVVTFVIEHQKELLNQRLVIK